MLTANTAYVFDAYSDATCTSGNKLTTSATDAEVQDAAAGGADDNYWWARLGLWIDH